MNINREQYFGGHLGVDPIAEIEKAIRGANDTEKKVLEQAREKIIKGFIIDVNNKLYELSKFMKFDISKLQYIVKEPVEKDEYGFPKEDTDQYKKAIIDAVLNDEKKRIEKFRNDSFSEERISSHKDNLSKKPFVKKVTESVPPPKTDWKKMHVNKHEEYKIKRSLKENPNKTNFSTEYKWNRKEFLEPFKYLESTTKYNGPLIISIVDNDMELEKYSKIDKLSIGINNISFGKYVLLSMYDISSTREHANYIYMGLIYIKKSGRLALDTFGSLNGEINQHQKFLIREFLDSMDIIYNDNHGDLNI